MDRRFLLLLAPALLVAWLYSRTPAADAHIRGVGRPTPALQSGPKPGSVLPAGEAAAEMRKAAPGPRGWLVLQVGECSSCLGEELRGWLAAAREQGYAPVLLTTSGGERLEAFRRDPALKAARIIQDRDGRLGAWLAAPFTPRAYLFDRDWKLQAAQSQPFPDARDPFGDPGLRGAR